MFPYVFNSSSTYYLAQVFTLSSPFRLCQKKNTETVSPTSDIFCSSFTFPLLPTAFLHRLFLFLTIYFLFCTLSIECHVPTAYFIVYAIAVINWHFWPQNPSILPRTHPELTRMLWDSFLYSTWKVISFWFVVTTISPTPIELALLEMSKSFQT
jgi:hypothetical protein